MYSWGDDYGQDELIRMSEKIYEYREKKKQLETELLNVESRYKYIPQRQSIVTHSMIFQLFFIIPITFMICTTFGSLWFFLDAFLLYADVRMIWKEIKLLKTFILNLDISFIVQLTEKQSVNTFRLEERKCIEQISLLKTQILDCDKAVGELLVKRKEAFAEKEKREETLRKHGVLIDTENNKTSRFTLREDSYGSEEAWNLHEYYLREERYIHEAIIKLEGRLQFVNKGIVKIDDDFDSVKKKIVLSILTYIVLVIFQSWFSGWAYMITAVFCIVITIIYVIYLERKCTEPILLYLVEHDSTLTKDYAFCNNIVPLYSKRNDLMESIEAYEKELNEIKDKKAKLVF